MNSVIEIMPLGARLDVPLLRRATSMSDSDPRAPAQQQKQLASGAGKSRDKWLDCCVVRRREAPLSLQTTQNKAPGFGWLSPKDYQGSPACQR